VGSVIADHVTIAARRQVDLGFLAGSGSDVSVSDPDARLLFDNLVDNAVRYSPSGGAVEVVLSTVGTDTVVEVIDSGCGIPDAALPRVFDRFFRAAPPNVEGNGLGLAIAKAVAERNGFELSINNRDNARGVIARVRIGSRSTIRAG
jgi:two-component system, OmpR family, sensor kinase